MPISPNDYMHPEDKKALENMQSIPLFPSLVKAYVNTMPEHLFYGMNMAQKVLLGPEQLPHVYNLLPPICERMGIPVPELYLEMNPGPNAYTFGDTRIFITITSGLLQYMDEDELRAVLAHECGHIACHHVLYQTMANMFIEFGSKIFGPLAAVATPVTVALLYWQRRSELSADRAAALTLQKVDPVIRTMIRLAGGPKVITDQLNIDLYIKQAEAFDQLVEKSWWDKALQGYAIMNQNHPFLSVRSREILRWEQDGHFQKVIQAMKDEESGLKCPQCNKVVKPEWSFCYYCGNPLPGLEV